MWYPPRGVVGLVVVAFGAGGTVFLVHRNQTRERKVRARPSSTPAACVSLAFLTHTRSLLHDATAAQAMREAVLRDIDKLGR